MDENHPTILEQISLLYDINIPTRYLSHISKQIDDANVGMNKLSTIISPETPPDFSFRLREVTQFD